MFDDLAFDAHEGVHAFHDAETGLRCIIAIHSTHLGPSAGGCRMWNYDSGAQMLTDVLRLSQGMSYKNAMAGLELGGGKAVIWGNSHTDKTPDLFRAFGRAVESLQGRYYTAEDVGIDVADIQIAGEETKFAAGLGEGADASGDPSPVTALGVFRGLKAAVERAFGSDELSDRSVAVQGVGSVGGYLCEHLAAAGAKLFISDVDPIALKHVAETTGATIVPPDEIYEQDVDVFSPNALGAIVNDATLERFKAKVIAGGANNQLIIPEMGEFLRRRGILYAPDYVINGGGIINVAAEIRGDYDRAWVDQKLDAMIATLCDVMDKALSENVSTNLVADRIARERIGRA
ncbi:MAG: Glu/Leu/Phe/Val dehydrogenase dimerization domain-containing protein [Pseudomonadota bacterium]